MTKISSEGVFGFINKKENIDIIVDLSKIKGAE